jgi:hypothetical protein
MLRKIIRAVLGKEDYELNIEVEIDIVDFLFILAFTILAIWVII